MGCGASSGRAVADSGVRTARTSAQERNTIPPESTREWLENAFRALLLDVKSIEAPPGEIPVVCIADNAVPLFLGSLEIGAEKTNVRMPIISMASVGSGYIICCSHKDMLHKGASEGNRRFVKNLMKFAQKKDGFMIPCLCVDWPKDLLQNVELLMQMGIRLDYGDFRTAFKKYPVVMVSSDLEIDDRKREKLDEYVSGGGVLFVLCHTRSDDHFAVNEEPINAYLKLHGLAYTLCSLSTCESSICAAPPQFDYVEQVRLAEIAEKYKSLLCEGTDIDVNALDDVVTALKYYVMVADEARCDVIVDIADHSVSFLKNSDYRQEDLLTTDNSQCLVLVMIDEFLKYATKIQSGLTWSAPDLDLFPGIVGDIPRDDYELNIEIAPHRLVSTGIWCPVGEKVVVTIDEFPNSQEALSVQMGIHMDVLMGKSGPWKRWPNVVQGVPFTSKRVECYSAYGGMLYLNVQHLDKDDITEVQVKVENAFRYPYFNIEQPDMYEETKDIPVPWGEAVGRNIIFTMRTEDMKRADLKQVLEFYDNLITKMAEFMSYEVVRQYRVVFDVDSLHKSGDFADRYPITLLTAEFDDICLNYQKPTASMFNLVTTLARVSLPEERFDTDTDLGLAAVIASSVIQLIFPQFDPLFMTSLNLPLLFKAFWKIHTQHNASLIPEILKNIQTSDTQTEHVDDVERWVVFFQEMCKLGGSNYTQFFEKIKPVPLNIVSSISSLPIPEFRSEVPRLPSL